MMKCFTESSIENILSITNVPNPAATHTTFEFSISRDGEAEIMIYSLKGELVARLGNNTYKAGNYKLNFAIGDLASGVYNVVLRNGSDRATTLMVIEK